MTFYEIYSKGRPIFIHIAALASKYLRLPIYIIPMRAFSLNFSSFLYTHKVRMQINYRDLYTQRMLM